MAGEQRRRPWSESEKETEWARMEGPEDGDEPGEKFAVRLSEGECGVGRVIYNGSSETCGQKADIFRNTRGAGMVTYWR